MSQRPPSSYRPPTSGVPVGMRPPTRTRNGSEAFTPSRGISVVNRPLTKQGLPSAHTHTGDRQVADKSYFIGILRNKINDTMKEIDRLDKEIEQRKRGQAIQAELEQQVEELRNDISQNEAVLSDYNVLSDRIQNGISIDEMNQSLQELEESNNISEQEINRLFREKKDLESFVVDQEQQVQEMMRGSTSPALKQMANEIDSLEAQCSQLRNQNNEVQGKSREELLEMVKSYTKKIGDLEKEIQDEQKSYNYSQNQIKLIKEREGDLQTERGQQYLKLLQKEKEMNNFIQNFPQTIETAKTDLSECQKRVFEILTNSSNDLQSISDLPSAENYNQLKNDLQIKERQMHDAQATTEQLSIQLAQRREELANLQNVDQKIEKEIELMKKQMKEMEEELPTFNDVDSIREEGELKKKQLTNLRDHLKQELLHLRKNYNALATKYNEQRSSLRSNNIHIKLNSVQKEIRKVASSNYAISECIEENRRRTNYSIVKRACMNIVNDINSLL
ncbi:intraflagellar transport protein [Histomonas meleagridis]|uniref:intraflagellar transport protein 74-like isoform X1 n=1 Tax=Histomonas meleagridis TaxID=135588 RepID=UPI003559F36B|nr:intraflagellar transport protein [Histomonas meleagridis]KAH0799309.1 intraflagellar transport protein 74-like isoform X1 [Histomonas meleagridis]